MSHKVAFTGEDDALLMKYIATYNPRPKGRLGMKLYERLVENTERKWSFSSRHSVQSWRERYKNNQQRFDAEILKYQKKHGISADAPVIPPSRAATPLRENQTNKRPRETDSGDEGFDSRVAKKMRQENAPHTRPPLVEPRDTGKARADPLFLEEDGDAPVIGADDYAGALSDSRENDQEAEYRASASARSFRSSRSVNQGAVKLFRSPSRSPSPSHVGATAALDRLPPNHDATITHHLPRQLSPELRDPYVDPQTLLCSRRKSQHRPTRVLLTLRVARSNVSYHP
ncbi:hypothetical protein BGW80DRAFT_848733 [Lactifluus volemus]|nr:hypothetical protein BGW80DRAFT_848733 [Lactifluus volemus]